MLTISSHPFFVMLISKYVGSKKHSMDATSKKVTDDDDDDEDDDE